jgi:hypothetical protein
VAGENTVFDRASIQRESHVRTAVIDGIDVTIVVIDGNDMAAAGHHSTAALLELMQGPNSNEVFNDSGRPRQSPGVERPVNTHGVAPLVRGRHIPVAQPSTTSYSSFLRQITAKCKGKLASLATGEGEETSTRLQVVTVDTDGH